jgi:hypothetical protein
MTVGLAVVLVQMTEQGVHRESLAQFAGGQQAIAAAVLGKALAASCVGPVGPSPKCRLLNCAAAAASRGLPHSSSSIHPRPSLFPGASLQGSMRATNTLPRIALDYHTARHPLSFLE